jgi:rare lipoprotein A
MQSLVRSATSLSQSSPLRPRLRAVIVLAALSSVSQSCGVISEAPTRAMSTKKVLPPETRISDSAIEPAPTHITAGEIPSIATIPSAPEREQVPPLEKIPELPQSPMVETGLASWYGPRFHGKRTASGEVFNQNDFTAAHRTLPWGSKVKITNVANGKSVEVRINDRGPFGKGRIIDVSRAAARALGIVGSGITTVRIEWRSDTEKSNELVLQDTRDREPVDD